MITTLLLLIIVALLIAAYVLWKKVQELQKNGTPNGVNPGSSDEICMEYTQEPMNTMNAAAVGNMVDEYGRHQLEYINAKMAVPAATVGDMPPAPDKVDISDSTSILFKLETLKKFIYHTELNSRRLGIKDSNVLGLRMYYAAYPEVGKGSAFDDFKDLPENYSYRHTLVMIPAKMDEKTGVFHDFNPIDGTVYTDATDASGASKKEKVKASKVVTRDYDTKIDALIEAKKKIVALSLIHESGAIDIAPNPGGGELKTLAFSGASPFASQNHGGLILPDSGSGQSLA